MELPSEKPDGILSPVTTDTDSPLLPGLHALGFTAPAGFSFTHWQGYMCYLNVESRALPWQLGDLLNWAETQGKEVEEAAIQYAYELGFADQTCRNNKSLAKRYPLHMRFGQLTHSHHNIVRGLDEPERVKLLEQAQAEKWTVADIKEAAKRLKDGDAHTDGNVADNAVAASVETGAAPLTYEQGYKAGLRTAIEIIEASDLDTGPRALMIDRIEAELAKVV